MIWTSLLAAASIAIVSNARATDVELPLEAPSDPSAGYSPGALKVSKTAHTSFKRKWDWTIYKHSETKELSLDMQYNKSAVVDYTVKVSPTYADAYWRVYGEIKIENPTDYAVKIVSVKDILTTGGGEKLYPTVDCGVTFPYTLTWGNDLTCTYSMDLPYRVEGTNKAVVETYGYDPSYATAPVTFGDPTEEVGKCIDVTDNRYGDLGYACGSEQSFWYSMAIEATMCGDYPFDNTASFKAQDDPTLTGSATHTIDVKVPCPQGCTRTQGYWKTHSEKGPAPYDNTWAKLQEGAKTLFYLSGKSWIECFNTPPKGVKYFILAHQLMAAKLNVYAGADSTMIKDVLKSAEEYFSWNKPTDSVSKEMEGKMTQWAEALDKYNSGQYGPPHCE